MHEVSVGDELVTIKKSNFPNSPNMNMENTTVDDDNKSTLLSE
jgi:hypothetical protein